MENKRITGEDFDQKLFRSLARIGSSMRGAGMPKLPSAGRRGVGGSVKPSRATRTDWPSDAEIADMVDRNGNGFVGDGEPWMTRVRRRARVRAQAGRSEQAESPKPVDAGDMGDSLLPMSTSRKKPKSKKPTTPDERLLAVLAEGASGNRKKHPARKRKTPRQEDIELVKNIVRFATKEVAEDNITYENVKTWFKIAFRPAFKANNLESIFDNEKLLKKIIIEKDPNTGKSPFDDIVEGAPENIQDFKFDTSPESNEILENSIAAALTDSPKFREIVELHGWPTTTALYTELPKTIKDRNNNLNDEELLFVTGGLTHGAIDIISFSSPLFNWWHRKKPVDDNVSEDTISTMLQRDDGSIPDATALNIEGVIRHEYGHYLENHISGNGTEKQREAIIALKTWFNNEIDQYRKAKALAEDLVTLKMLELDLDPAEDLSFDYQTLYRYERGKIMRQFPIIAWFDWLSDYGKTNDREFLAEIFTMATSSNPKVKEKVPPAIRETMETWLDAKIFE